MTSLNPTYTIGNQLREAILLHTNRNHEQANARAVEMLKLVGVTSRRSASSSIRTSCPAACASA